MYKSSYYKENNENKNNTCTTVSLMMGIICTVFCFLLLCIKVIIICSV
jgi:hypothetical protein